jgi:hypothetical protein
LPTGRDFGRLTHKEVQIKLFSVGHLGLRFGRIFICMTTLTLMTQKCDPLMNLRYKNDRNLSKGEYKFGG